ncbi:hypothetical protein MNBD_BACTEROID02-229 [hydrothermal vent metagenome]|uniref:Uncharacterized protein n=1 Tax=hydrothermal vent metagenome TaxID=652676 RepID=A0A3B0RNU8_9ZZZZ
MLRGIVSVGLLTLVGCLIPVLLGRYGIENNLLWRWSSGAFFTLIWFALLHPAFYTTAIILNLVQAGILLVQIVYAAKSENNITN